MPKDKKPKGKKTKAPRKAQPLPRSVQALLKYLGGTDVKLGGARGGQSAQLAPTSINIAVSQQQQAQQQAQQFMSQRFAPKGQVIGKSPLSAVIPQPVIMAAPASTAETERKLQAQERQAEVKQNELNRKFGLLEASQKDFQRAAIGAYQEVKQDISRRITGDANIFDARNIAARFKARPVVEEQQFAGVTVGEEEGWTDIETGAGEFQAGQYIQNVTNPEMTAIERSKRGRKPLSQEVKEARAEERRLAKESARIFKRQIKQTEKAKKQLNVPASSAALLEANQPTELSGFRAVATESVRPSAAGGAVVRRPIVTLSASAPDMATQIALLTRGQAAETQQLQGGISIAQMMGMTGQRKVIKKISPDNK